MMQGLRARRPGFTLIEVSLAIVIGVVILAGGITLYNQVKLSAGNSRAQEKVQGLANLVEEMAAASGTDTYPTLAVVQAQWPARRADAYSSPWGGDERHSVTPWPSPWLTYAGAGYCPTFSAMASGGELIYMTGTGTTSIMDESASSARTWNSYACAIVDSQGQGPCFVLGGK